MKQLRTAAIILFLAPALLRGATDYSVDNVHSTVEFGARHMVISTVKGHFSSFEGTITVDGKDPAQWEISGKIDVSSIDTGDEKRDTHLKSADFFDVEKYPDITFQSREIRRSGNQFICAGTFTMHGTSREVEIPFKLTGPITDPWGNARVGLESSWSIHRKDYGISWSETLDGGGLVVGDEITVELNIEGVHPGE